MGESLMAYEPADDTSFSVIELAELEILVAEKVGRHGSQDEPINMPAWMVYRLIHQAKKAASPV